MLNDFSGSPKILSLIIRGVVRKGYIAELYTSTSLNGFLSGLEGVIYHNVPYRLTGNKPINILLFVSAQFRYFFSMVRYLGSSNTVIYINTLLPVGAAIGSVFFSKKIFCHLHEDPSGNGLFNRFSLFIINRFSEMLICVSDYQYQLLNKYKCRKVLIYNALDEDFVMRAHEHKPVFREQPNILMACSLREYKGVDVFIIIAEKLPDLSFTLILNSDEITIKSYFRSKKIPENIEIISGSGNLIEFYEKASLVLNLSQPGSFVETFGLTVLEAISFGIPVIVPNVGGITELVDDGSNGFCVNTSEPLTVINKIKLILSDEEKYNKMSECAKKKSGEFSGHKMIDRVVEVIR